VARQGVRWDKEEGKGMKSQAELTNLMRTDGTISLAMLAISVTQFRARPSIACGAIADIPALCKL
jgi:hypothetical protein